jgi:hypothetical protein
MNFSNRLNLVAVCLGLSVLFCSFSQILQAETLIYSNTTEYPYFYTPGSGEEVIDFGTSTGGNICKFTFAYVTEQRNTAGWIIVRFYRYTSDYSPGYLVKSFAFYASEVPGSPDGSPTLYYHEHEIAKSRQFTLPSGQFGYSFEFESYETGALIARGGTGNEDAVWYYDDWWDDWFLMQIYPYSGFYMEVYEGFIIPNPRIHGYKFEDINTNGQWDEEEPTLPGWEIYLDLNDNGQFDYGEPNSITDPNGMYDFERLEPGTYKVAEVLKDGWAQTYPAGDGTHTVVADMNEVYLCNFGNYEGGLTVKLSGNVLTDEYEPIDDVLISASTGQSTTTNESGYYELMLPAPWSGTITPSKECYNFDPAVYGYSNLNTDTPDQDFTAIPICFYGGGFGTEGDPYLINTAEHMQEIGTHPEHWGLYFRLMNDIDMAAFTGDSYNIIGYYEDSVDNEPFSGVFNGNGHKVYNFTYSSPASLYNVGVFGYVSGSGAEIRDLTLVEPQVTVSSGTVVGSLVGWISQGTISRCAVTGGSVSGNGAVGGLAGQVGYFGQSTLDQCYTKCEVIGNNDIGGLAGWVFDGTVINCYSTGNVVGSDTVGGLIGDCEDQVSNCYSVADVAGSTDCGALIGNNSGTASNCFWDTDISSPLTGVGAGDSSGIEGKTTEQMQTILTFVLVGWDFAAIWDICEAMNYPKLQCQQPPVGDIVCPDGVEVADFAIIAAYWLETGCGSCGGAELSGDGNVGLPDLEIFIGNWMAEY